MQEINVNELQNKLSNFKSVKGAKLLYYDNGNLTMQNHKIRVDVEFDFIDKFCIEFATFSQYIKNIKTDTVLMEIKDDRMILKASRKKADLFASSEGVGVFPEHMTFENKGNEQLNDNFQEIIEFFANINYDQSDERNQKLNSVFFSDNKVGYTDGKGAVLKETDIGTDINFAMDIENMHLLKNYHIEDITFDEELMKCKFEDGIISFQKKTFDNPPAIDYIISTLTDMEKINFPLELYSDIPELLVTARDESIDILNLDFQKDFTIATTSNLKGNNEIKYRIENDCEIPFRINMQYLPFLKFMEGAEVHLSSNTNNPVIKFENKEMKTIIVVMGMRR